MKKIFLGFIIFLNSCSVSNDDIRKGNITMDNLPNIIIDAINFFMKFAGTIAVIFVIVGAYKILFGSLEQDKTKGKDTIIMALIGFGIASLAWVIVKLILNNFG